MDLRDRCTAETGERAQTTIVFIFQPTGNRPNPSTISTPHDIPHLCRVLRFTSPRRLLRHRPRIEAILLRRRLLLRPSPRLLRLRRRHGRMLLHRRRRQRLQRCGRLHRRAIWPKGKEAITTICIRRLAHWLLLHRRRRAIEAALLLLRAEVRGRRLLRVALLQLLLRWWRRRGGGGLIQ